MKIIGLTGGIASGKNFVAEIFSQNNAAIFDADIEVHKLMELDKSIIQAVKKNFPESFIDAKIDRKILGKIVFADAKKLQILEKIIHPKIREKYQDFLTKSESEKRKFVVLNIPLLLETKAYKCDKILAIIASPSVQKKRFLARVGKVDNQQELEKKFEQIRSKQISNEERKKVADFVVNTNGAKSDVVMQVKNIIDLLR